MHMHAFVYLPVGIINCKILLRSFAELAEISPRGTGIRPWLALCHGKVMSSANGPPVKNSDPDCLCELHAGDLHG